MSDLVQQIDAILPQTQCTQCGYTGCLPYAQAIAEDAEQINRCPPGGESGIAQLAALLVRPVMTLNPDCGETKPLHIALIDEAHCIGCTLCIRACPVDAIVGANKFMHTVIADLCSGCELCIPVCPVDCMTMKPAQREWMPADAQAARQRHRAREDRLQRLKQAEEQRLNQRSSKPSQALSPSTQKPAAILRENQQAQSEKQAAIAAALARARANRAKAR